jgi:hypothetical protein
VVGSVTLQAINPHPGQPTSTTVTTTRYAGDSTQGVLGFQPPELGGAPRPAACGCKKAKGHPGWGGPSLVRGWKRAED